MSAEPELIVVADPDEVEAVAAARIVASLARSVEAHSRANWVTTGGSAPIGIYRHLTVAPLRDGVAWEAVHVWWGDDRYVPRDHPLSNVKPLDDILLGIAAAEEGQAGRAPLGVPLSIENLHPFQTAEAIAGSLGADWCAAALAEGLRTTSLAFDDHWPVFDLILLGIGADGHLLSVFPHSAAFDSQELALAIPAPTHIEPRVPRLTLNPAVIGVAQEVLVVVSGASKAPILADIFGDQTDPRRWPGQLARRSGATWVLDAAAASNLHR